MKHAISFQYSRLKRQKFNKFKIQKEIYKDIKQKYGLNADMTIRAIAKVAGSYKINKTQLHRFNPNGAIVYDHHLYSFKTDDLISIST